MTCQSAPIRSSRTWPETTVTAPDEWSWSWKPVSCPGIQQISHAPAYGPAVERREDALVGVVAHEVRPAVRCRRRARGASSAAAPGLEGLGHGGAHPGSRRSSHRTRTGRSWLDDGRRRRSAAAWPTARSISVSTAGARRRARSLDAHGSRTRPVDVAGMHTATAAAWRQGRTTRRTALDGQRGADRPRDRARTRRDQAGPAALPERRRRRRRGVEDAERCGDEVLAERVAPDLPLDRRAQLRRPALARGRRVARSARRRCSPGRRSRPERSRSASGADDATVRARPGRARRDARRDRAPAHRGRDRRRDAERRRLPDRAARCGRSR